MRVLIFGATGFAGRYLARELVEGGHEVYGAVRSPEDGGTNPHPVPLRVAQLLRCDVVDPVQVDDVVSAAGADAVVLLAGVAAPREANGQPADAFRVHVQGTVNVLDAVRRRARPTRVLVATSSEAYGGGDTASPPLEETAALQPSSVYAASKAAADLAAKSIGLGWNLDVVRVRPFNHTGPGQRRGFVCPDFASQIAAVAAGRRPPVVEVGDLAPERDFSDVRDIARGYAAALLRGTKGEVYNLCTGRRTPIGEILRVLCELAGVAPAARVQGNGPPDVSAYCGNPKKAERELGWQAQIPLRQTLADLLDWYSAVER
jgi:GDP-4-dehydro-6-deoxy-D-mannose reductase